MSKAIQNQGHSEPIVVHNPTTASSSMIIEKFLTAASVEAVYGEPIEHGDVLVIPSAEILSVGGFGLGSGGEQEDGGSGGGGGGRVFSRPVAVIISEPQGVRVEPIIDATKIALAFFTAIGFMASMAARMGKGKID